MNTPVGKVVYFLYSGFSPDQFPVVIVLSLEQDHILGMNIHELEPKIYHDIATIVATGNPQRIILLANILKPRKWYYSKISSEVKDLPSFELLIKELVPPPIPKI